MFCLVHYGDNYESVEFHNVAKMQYQKILYDFPAPPKNKDYQSLRNKVRLYEPLDDLLYNQKIEI